MNSRDRLNTTLNHRQPDRVCVDFGGTNVSGIAASAVHRLRQAVLGEKDYRVKVVEPYQILGEIDDKLRSALGVDVISIGGLKSNFGFENTDWKPFELFDGTPVLVPGKFNVTADAAGDLLIYPEGDTSVAPSGRMPKGGFYFDAIPRQEPIDEDKLDPADNLVDFPILSPEDLRHYRSRAEQVAQTPYGVVLGMPGMAFGDIGRIPATHLKRTPGIREIEEWYVSIAARRDYVWKVFEGQCEVALKNLPLLAEAVGAAASAAFVTGTDFGTQRGPFIAPKTYRDLYKPFHRAVNDWIHRYTSWKTFIHSCGSVIELIPDFIDAGFDILNPVQCSAEGMDPRTLKDRFGDRLVFWGGGVDTQKTLSFGTPAEVYDEVRHRIDIFNAGGGFVFNAIHNVQATTPTENMLAMFKAIKEIA